MNRKEFNLILGIIGILCFIIAYLIIWNINNKLDKKLKIGKYKEKCIVKTNNQNSL